jgi:phosphatidylglycerol:prolipoprotein diacylglycerol transferase
VWPIIVTIPLPFGWGKLPLPAFGFMVVVAFLTSIGLMRRFARKEGIAPAKLEPLFTIILLGTVVGGRLFHVLTNLGDFRDNWLDAIRIDKGGMVMYGGLIAVVAGGLWYLKAAKLPVWQVADVGAVSGALALGLGRVGCMLAGCDYGNPVDPSFPLAVRFPSQTQPGSLLGMTVPAIKTTPLAPTDHFVHFTQLYQSVAGILSFFLLWWLWKHRKFPGQVFATFLFLKPAYRFVIEYFRGDSDRGVMSLGPLGTLSQAQVIGVVVAAIAVVLYVVLSRRAARVPAPA